MLLDYFLPSPALQDYVRNFHIAHFVFPHILKVVANWVGSMDRLDQVDKSSFDKRRKMQIVVMGETLTIQTQFQNSITGD